jgi:hypothetical protein
MTKLQELLTYLIPKIDPAYHSRKRILEILFFIDWVSVLGRKKQVSNVVWIRDRNGVELVNFKDSELKLENFTKKTFFQRFSEFIFPKNSEKMEGIILLSEADISFVDLIIEHVNSMEVFDFTRVFYSIYAITMSDYGQKIDLNELSKRYKFEQRAIKSRNPLNNNLKGTQESLVGSS